MGRKRSTRKPGHRAGKTRTKPGFDELVASHIEAAEREEREAGPEPGLELEPSVDRVRLFPESTVNENPAQPGPDPALNGASSDESARLVAEANAALAAAPIDAVTVDGTAPGGELVDPDQSAKEWALVTKGVVTGTALVILPQWNLTDEEQGELADSLAHCCAQLFPGGINGKYACWVRLIAATTAIAGSRFIANGGKFPPIGPRVEKPAPSAEHAAAPAA